MSKKNISLFRCPYGNHGDVAIDTAVVADYRATHLRSGKSAPTSDKYRSVFR